MISSKICYVKSCISTGIYNYAYLNRWIELYPSLKTFQINSCYLHLHIFLLTQFYPPWASSSSTSKSDLNCEIKVWKLLDLLFHSALKICQVTPSCEPYDTNSHLVTLEISDCVHSQWSWLNILSIKWGKTSWQQLYHVHIYAL